MKKRKAPPEDIQVPAAVSIERPERRIYKYVLKTCFRQVGCVDLPQGAQILAVGKQDAGFVLWGVVVAEEAWPTEARYFTIMGTGDRLTVPVESLEHLGTIGKEGARYVWHVFEVHRFSEEVLPIQIQKAQEAECVA